MRAALAFLTPLPVGAARVPDRDTLVWFPLIGALIGLGVAGAWWAAAEVFPPLVAAAVAVAVDVVLTGALHLDGLADSADGLLAHHRDAERRREVMAAPDVGAFGVAAVVLVLLLRWAALASLVPDGWLLLVLWAASRSVMVLALALVRYVGGGLGATMAGGPVWMGVQGSVGAAVVAGVSLGAGGVAAVVGCVVAATAVVLLGRRRLGGVTGDVLGAAGVLGETVGLVVATASW